MIHPSTGEIRCLYPPPIGAVRVCLLAIGLLVASSLIAPRTASAGPEVVCAWCITISDELGNSIHGFPNPSDQCGSPNPGGDCQRCGGTSNCHAIGAPAEGDGPCNHVACGGENLAMIQGRLGDAIEAGDALVVRQLLAEHHVGVSIHNRVEAGRLELVVDCDPNAVAVTFALPPSLQAQLRRLATVS